jgi:archaemetzincin
MDRITLIPIGPISQDLLKWLAARLGETLGRPVEIGDSTLPPRGGYRPDRGQYRGDAVISGLWDLRYPQSSRLVGLIDADCYSPGLNFIFGQASMSGREAFVALPRLRQSFYSLLEDAQLFKERVLKEIIHELGHTWGLSHCPDLECVMHFSNTLQDTDVKRAKFCPECRQRIKME